MNHDSYRDACVQAVSLAAQDLGLNAAALAEEIAHGEIGLLIRYLRRAAPFVDDAVLRADIDALLHRLTAWTGQTP